MCIDRRSLEVRRSTRARFRGREPSKRGTGLARSPRSTREKVSTPPRREWASRCLRSVREAQETSAKSQGRTFCSLETVALTPLRRPIEPGGALCAFSPLSRVYVPRRAESRPQLRRRGGGEPSLWLFSLSPPYLWAFLQSSSCLLLLTAESLLTPFDFLAIDK